VTEARTVLIVEDEPLISMMLEDFLDTLGHRVAASCDSLSDAILRVEQGGFDIAIIDVNLKGELIWPVADRLQDRNIPYVLATGGHIEPPPSRHADAPVLSKPYTIDKIDPVLKEAVGA
jgi:CheY-like chemotaxis protein